jgi:catechol 2,3-dioxygenase-like lactoylglutathione lyase family enzyme
MKQPAIAKLGHVGIYVNDLEAERAFYRDIMGLTITDEDLDIGLVFMSARPTEEHHEFLLARGREADYGVKLIQQISFRCNSLDDVIGYYRRLRENGVRIHRCVSHGNAISVYFYDPEGNRCEVYWDTGLKARQPYLELVDLDTDPGKLMDEVRESVRRHGTTGLARASDFDRNATQAPPLAKQ